MATRLLRQKDDMRDHRGDQKEGRKKTAEAKPEGLVVEIVNRRAERARGNPVVG
jgi:hypothetical protein